MAEEIVVANLSPHRTRSRSTKGCWTCRLRRKKCDETPDHCLMCQSLQIDCFGYGSKPPWMDGGAREKQQAQELKAQVNRQRKQGRRKSIRSNSYDGTPRLSHATCIPVQTDAAAGSYTATTPQHVSEAVELSSISALLTVQGVTDEEEAPDIDMDLTDPPSAPESVVTPSDAGPASASYYSFQNQEAPIPFEPQFTPVTPVDLDLTSGDYFWQTWLEDVPSFDPMPTPDVFRSPLKIKSTAVQGCNVTPSPSDITVCETRTNRLSGMSEDEHGWTAAVDGKSTAVSSTTHLSRTHDLADDEHILFYTRTVVPTIPVLRDLRVQTMLRDRLFAANSSSALKNSAVASTLAFRKQGLERFGFYRAEINMGDDLAQKKLYVLADIRSILNTQADQIVDDEVVIDTALAVLNLILLQIRDELSTYDQLAALIAPLLDTCRPLADQGNAGAKLACSTLLAIDVLRSASSRKKPAVIYDAEMLRRMDLASLDIMPQIIGCEPRLLHCIAQVNLLRLWKEEQTVSSSLNVIELVRKATALEQALNEEQQTWQASGSLGQRRQSSEGSSPLVAAVYAAAIKIYIHVVVSGPNPTISDIRKAVQDAVDALMMTHDHTVLQWLAWPICIVASFAEAQHDSFFDRLYRGAREDKETYSGVLRSLAVAQECRRLRETSSRVESCDWMRAMESLGRDWVLL